MARSSKEQKVHDGKCNREFQIGWTEKHGLISKGDKERVIPARIISQSNRNCWSSTLPLTSALIQKDFGGVLGVQPTKHLPHVAKVDLVWQLGGIIWVNS
ncbi:hypothetical protein TNCV_1405481 [Trichonephila clavipes]|nr:hypothetical protein TNCV_1405481 [Trichonephila clavipes]